MSQKGAPACWGSNEALSRAPSPSMQPAGQPLHAIPPGRPGPAHWLRGWERQRSSSTTRARSATSLDSQHGVVVMETWRQCIRSIKGKKLWQYQGFVLRWLTDWPWAPAGSTPKRALYMDDFPLWVVQDLHVKAPTLAAHVPRTAVTVCRTIKQKRNYKDLKNESPQSYPLIHDVSVPLSFCAIVIQYFLFFI